VSITGLLHCIKNPLEVSAGILLEVRFSEVLHPLILMQIDAEFDFAIDFAILGFLRFLDNEQ